MARYYVWRGGRFLSVDPVAGSISDPQSLNRYAYVLNNPISYIDPSGMVTIPGNGGFGDGGGIGPCDELGIVLCGPPGSGLPCASEDISCGGIPFPVGGGSGGGGGGRPGSSGPTPLPGPPINVGSPIDDPGMGTGPIWTEQIPISSGPLSPWLIIQNFAQGNGWTWSPCPTSSTVGFWNVCLYPGPWLGIWRAKQLAGFPHRPSPFDHLEQIPQSAWPNPNAPPITCDELVSYTAAGAGLVAIVAGETPLGWAAGGFAVTMDAGGPTACKDRGR
jgi:hypothetical protein